MSTTASDILLNLKSLADAIVNHVVNDKPINSNIISANTAAISSLFAYLFKTPVFSFGAVAANYTALSGSREVILINC